MAINYGLKGYVIQTLIAVLKSLDNDNDWVSISIEPDIESEKVDIKWTFPENRVEVYQVKSSKNTFDDWKVKSWCDKLTASTDESYTKILLLVGRLRDTTAKRETWNGVKIEQSEVYSESDMLDIASNRIDEFYEAHGKPKIPSSLRKILVEALTNRFTLNSIIGQELSRENFTKLLLEWIASIEEWINKNPLMLFSQFPKSDGNSTLSHETLKRLLQLIGWNQFNENEKVNWFDEKANEEKSVNLDFRGELKNRLTQNTQDNVIINGIDNVEYPESPNEQLKKFYLDSKTSIDFLKEEGLLDESDDNKKELHNIMLWLSMGLSDQDRFYILETFDAEYGNRYMAKDCFYYVLDNNRLKFLISSIITARNYRENVPTKFLYPITQSNLGEDSIGQRDTQLPVEYINSTIIPIIKEDAKTQSILLFCADSFSPDGLRKLIWLLVKLTSGFGNEYQIYFPDYSQAESNIAKEVIRSFDDEILEARITILSIPDISASQLAALPARLQDKSVSKRVFNHEMGRTELVNSIFTDYLPYGDLLRPFLNTDQIKASDLKYFLAKRGIFFKNADKTKMINLMSTLLFSPSELLMFKEMIDIKEKTGQNSEKFCTLSEGTTIENVYENLLRPLVEDLQKGTETKIIRIGKYSLDKSSKTISLELITKDENPNNHISVNTTLGKVNIELRVVNNTLLLSNMNTISRGDRIIANKIIKNNTEHLKSENLVQDDLRQIQFTDFDNNLERVHFLLSFSNIDSLEYVFKHEIQGVRFHYDETLEIPDELKDKTEKDLVIYFNGRNLEGLKEITDDDLKKLLHIEQIKIWYPFKWKNVGGSFHVIYKFPKDFKTNTFGSFRTEFKLIKNRQIQALKDISKLEKELSAMIDNFKIEKFNQFGLI